LGAGFPAGVLFVLAGVLMDNPSLLSGEVPVSLSAGFILTLMIVMGLLASGAVMLCYENMLKVFSFIEGDTAQVTTRNSGQDEGKQDQKADAGAGDTPINRRDQ